MTARIIAFGHFADVSSIRVRLAPIDVGFDLRAQHMAVSLPADTMVASYADHVGNRFVVEGTWDEIARVLRKAGYTIERG